MPSCCADLQLLAMVRDLLEVLGLELMQRLQVVLLHVVVQRVLEVGHTLKRLARLYEAGAEYCPGEL